jgi:putative sterol carrier protein
LLGRRKLIVADARFAGRFALRAPARSLDAISRRNADPTSVFLSGIGRVSKPDVSPRFADVDAAAKAAIMTGVPSDFSPLFHCDS